jgi:hypothetical protein
MRPLLVALGAADCILPTIGPVAPVCWFEAMPARPIETQTENRHL